MKPSGNVLRARKAHTLTQVQLAKTLGISQQTLAHYEVARLRISVKTLVAVANALSLEELVNEPIMTAQKKRGPVPKLQQQIQQVSDLPRTNQKFVMDMLDTILQQAS